MKIGKILKIKHWFCKKIANHQIATFTILFFLFFRLLQAIIFYIYDKNTFFKLFNSQSLAIPAIILIITFFAEWLFVIWIISKLSKDKLRQKLLESPLITIIFLTGFLLKLSERVIINFWGEGMRAWVLVHFFEEILVFGFIYFVLWLLVIKISRKIKKPKECRWIWYNDLINKLIAFIPTFYEYAIALVVGSFIFSICTGWINLNF